MTRRSIIIATIAILLIGFVALKQSRAQAHVESGSYDLMLATLLKHNVAEINIADAAADTTAIFLDAREKNEFDVSHISGAIWVGYDDFSADRLQGIDTTRSIIVYCSVGYRSEVITGKLLTAGYHTIYNLYGGIFEWVNEGYIVVDNEGNPTARVHAYSKKWGVWLNKGEKVYE